MEDRIEELERRIYMLEKMFDNQWQLLLDDIVREYIKEYYPYGGIGDTNIYFRVLESMKEQIKTLLMGGDH